MASIDRKALYSTHIGIYPTLHLYAFKLLNYIPGSNATGEL
jgi:hypothetical protein